MAEVRVAAEWPGRVAEVHVAAGDHVEPEQELITLESMKMLTPVVAPSGGEVVEVSVAVDDFVDQGGLLVRLST